MNYAEIYEAVIARYRQNPPNKRKEYCEDHHVKPRSFGGTDDPENIVTLPVRVHIFCHELLYKHWKDLAWQMRDDEVISKAGLMALALDRLRNGTERQTKVSMNFKSKVFANAKADGHETLKHMIWINDGQKNTMVDSRNPNAIPAGWSRGMLYRDQRKGRIWVTNGKTDLHLDPGIKIPTGYIRGRTKGCSSAAHMTWITDGHTDKYIDNSESIPAGWRKGRSGIAGEKSGQVRRNRIHEYNGKLYTQGELSKLLGYSMNHVCQLLKQGLTPDDIAARKNSGVNRRKGVKR